MRIERNKGVNVHKILLSESDIGGLKEGRILGGGLSEGSSIEIQMERGILDELTDAYNEWCSKFCKDAAEVILPKYKYRDLLKEPTGFFVSGFCKNLKWGGLRVYSYDGDRIVFS